MKFIACFIVAAAVGLVAINSIFNKDLIAYHQFAPSKVVVIR